MSSPRSLTSCGVAQHYSCEWQLLERCSSFDVGIRATSPRLRGQTRDVGSGASITNEFDVDAFHTDGIARVGDAFSPQSAGAMGDAIWRRIEAHTSARRDDPSTWAGVTLPSFKPIKQRPVFRAATESASLATALDAVFGAGAWRPSRSGVQVLFTFPNATTWVLPHSLWHMDTGFGPVTPTRMVKVFCCLDCHEPGGGATLALAGSHRLVERYRRGLDGEALAGNTTTWSRMLRQDPWTRELINRGAEPERTERLMGSVRDIDGVPVRLVEMTGRAGDAFVTDIHTFHCAAPNACDRPRLMVACVFQTSGEQPQT